MNSAIKSKIRFENTTLNQWKKFLLHLDKDGIENFLTYFNSLNHKSQNVVELINWVKGYLHDLKISDNILIPAEYNIDCYDKVT